MRILEGAVVAFMGGFILSPCVGMMIGEISLRRRVAARKKREGSPSELEVEVEEYKKMGHWVWVEKERGKDE